MKKFLTVLSILGLCSCGGNSDVLTEQTFFLVMTNIQAYPEEYTEKTLTFDCFTYELKSTDNTSYLCGVRQCSSGFGCKCGKDTIIGFILNSDKELPAPKNQYDNSNDKAWIHVTGKLESSDKKTITISATDGTSEEVQFLSFNVSEFSVIEDYSSLHHYVDK